MTSPVDAPKPPNKIIGWTLVSLGVVIGVAIGVSVFFMGNEIGGAIGGGLQGLGGLLCVILPYKIITYGRRRMAERAEDLINLD